MLFASEGARVVVAADIDGSSASETARLIEAAGGAAEARELGRGRAGRGPAGWVGRDRRGPRVPRRAVNCAGVRGPMAPVGDLAADEWRTVMAVNLDGVFWCMQAEINAMLAGGGVIVNIASGAVTEPHPGLSAYGASKAAVVHLTRTAAVEYAGSNIRINAVLPGRTRTPMLEDYYRRNPGAASRALESAPMKRLGEPSELAETIVWLCSDRASYVAGVALLVDGASHAGRSR